METNAKKLGIVLFTMATVFLGCKKDEVQPVSSDTSFEEKKTEGKIGKWHLTSFTVVDADAKPVDKTDNFRDWKFYFNADGTVQAKSDKEVVTGDWMKEEEPEGKFMTIKFPVESPVKDISNKYKLVTPSKTILDLEKKVNGVVSKLKFQLVDLNISDVEEPYDGVQEK